MLSVTQGGIKYHFWVFSMTLPGIGPRSPGPLSNTLLIRPMTHFSMFRGIHIYSDSENIIQLTVMNISNMLIVLLKILVIV